MLSKTQAILALRGKVLNVERARLDRILSSQAIKDIIIALGAAIGDTFDISKLRYHKIIIATDADVDGAHIRTLLLTLLFRHFQPLLDAGHIYIAQPPLYKLTKGKDVHYAYDDHERDKTYKQMGGNPSEVGQVVEEEDDNLGVGLPSGSPTPSRIKVQRYKGLGEMNPEELWETTMNPESRVLLQVSIVDAALADKTFDILMGNEVEPRKLFIQANAKLAELDV